ncbi:M14 family zinc carboxypeptidase [Halomarina oriensis]|uniref:Peptidase M14 domain-containing protein n=1 Tax=Halomarina oriensis TaxID=671145 RepID=A0A6B0GGX8_9EURY|nr:M14 family zinc carboxypeptidase [Halomarina oriensis]MWG34132.1 hypothetical protein [Halomarina oriensis]
MSNNDRLDRISTAFDDSTTTRRDFLRASAGLGGGLAIPGEAFRDFASPRRQQATITDLFVYVYRHTPSDRAIPTLLSLDDDAAFERLGALDAPVRTTTDPTTAAHADLTPSQVESVLGLGEDAERVPGLTGVEYAPGSTPFWKLDHYPQGVFPTPEESIDYVRYEQAIAGMEYLGERHADRLRVTGLGESPGWYNTYDLEVDPETIYVAEVTNDVGDEAAFTEKEKILYSLSIHGDERSGVEAGTRTIEDVLVGDDEDLAGMLDEVVLVFLFPNPDGWVAPSPEYFSGDEVEDDDLVRVDAFRRQTGTELDMNRQWPTVGYIDPTHNPAEPDGSNLEDDTPGVDDDVPERYTDLVPGALSVVEFLRDYENLNYGTDLHGMFDSEQYILGLIMNTEYDARELHDLYELNKVLGSRLEESVGPLLEENRDAFREFIGTDDATFPDTSFSYGTIYDTISYTTTGTFGSWFATPEELGGLDLVSMSPEMSFDNRVGDQMQFVPGNVETQVAGYRTFIRTFADQATTTIETEIATEGRSTAYVTTDALTRSSGDLPFTDDGNGDGENGNGNGGNGNGTGNGNDGDGGDDSAPVAFQIDVAVGEVIEDLGAEADGFYRDQGRLLQATTVLADGTVTNEVTVPDGEVTKTLGGCAVTYDAVDYDPETAEATLDVSVSEDADCAGVTLTLAGYDLPDGDTTFDRADAADQELLDYRTVTLDAGDSELVTVSLADGLGDDGDDRSTLSRQETTLSVPGGGRSQFTATVEAGSTLHVGVDGVTRGRFDGATLQGPDGSVVRSHDPATSRTNRPAVWTVTDPTAGEWTVVVDSATPDRASVGVSVATLQSASSPDPEAILGYQQREYEVTPFEFFEQYAEYADGSLDAVGIEEVANGDLLDGDSLAYDNLVVIHADGATDGAYVSALDAFVEAGGNLVLTDTGVNHLANLSAAGADAIPADAVTPETFVVANLGRKRDHPLLGDVRSIQRELYKVAPLGYPIGDDAPMTLVDTATFESAGGEVAATTEELVSLGALGSLDGGVQVVGGVLPPATQEALHPFGLHDYAVSFLGLTVLANALGHTQRRLRDGEVVATFGRDGETAADEGESDDADDADDGVGHWVESA